MDALTRVELPRPGRRRAMRAVELLLWAIAAITLGAALSMLAEAYVYQHTAQLPAPGAAAAPQRVIAEGSPIARLTIPRLGLDVVVAEGSSDDVLRKAAGRLTGSARPGERGNVVIAGHRDTFFRPLAGIRKNDLIVLESAAGEQRYRVEWTRIVEPDEVGVLASSGRASLTLVTCYPFRYVGSAPRRFIVRARGEPS